MNSIRNSTDWNSLSTDDYCPPGSVSAVLVGPPHHFAITDVRNEHMRNQIGKVDVDQALHQWSRFCDSIQDLGLEVHAIDPPSAQADAVFTANPSLCTSDRAGNPRVILGRMSHPNRIPESECHRCAYQQLGLRCEELPQKITSWEGNGDTLRDLTRPLLWCGLGPRSELSGHIAAGEMLDLSVAFLELQDPRYYHLDTALALLNGKTAAFVRDAFTAEGIDLLHTAFDHLIEVDPVEAESRLAGNMWSPDGKHVLITSETPVTSNKLEEMGFRPIEIETGEFLKSGGSVFCMRQEIRDAR